MLKEIFKNSLYATVAKIISLVLGFISSIFFIRLLGAEGKGNLSVLEVSCALFVLVTSLNLNVSIIHFATKDRIKLNKLLGLSIIIFAFSLLLSIILIFGLTYLKLTDFILPKEDILTYAFLLLIMIILLELKEIFSSFLKGRKFFKDLYQSALIYSIFRLILFAFLYFLHIELQYNFSLTQLIFAHIICLFILMISSFYFFKKEINIKPSFKFSFIEIKPLMIYSSIGFLVIFINFLSRKSDVWIVNYMLDARQLGFYAIAITLGDFVLQIPMTIKNVLFPYLSSSDSKKERIMLMALFSRFNSTIMVMVILALSIVANKLIPLMYGKDFLEAVFPFRFFIIGIGFIGFKEFFQIYNMSTENQRINVWANLIGLLFLSILNFYLIPFYGITGAAIAMMFSFILSTLWLYSSMLYYNLLPHQNYFMITLNDLKKIYSLIIIKIRK